MSTIRRTVLAAALCVLALAGLLPTAAAAAAERTLLSETITEPGWRAYKLRSDGSQYRISWLMPKANKPVSVAAWLYDTTDNGDPYMRSGFTWTSFAYQDAHYYDVQVVDGVGVQEDTQGTVYEATTPIMIGNSLPGTPANPKTYTLMLWWAGDTDNGIDFKMVTDGGVRLGEMTSGPEVYLLMSKDFDATANAGVQRTLPPMNGYPNGIGGGARATANATRTITTKGSLIGSWRAISGPPLAAQANALLVTRPNGSTLVCDCSWYQYGFAGLASGKYTFTQSGAGAGVGLFGDMLFAGADVTFPTCEDHLCFPDEQPAR